MKKSGIAAREAIAIGDEVRDVEAATAAGIASGAVAWGYATPSRLAAQRPTEMFDTIEALTARLLAGTR